MQLPPPLNWLWTGWLKLSEAIGFVMSRILLTVLWIVAFGIYAVIQKTIGLFALSVPAQTYWKDCEPDYPESMKHPF